MNKIYIPKENVSDNTAKVTDLLFKNKEAVSEGDLIMSVETSKADIDIEAEVDGYILYLTHEGDNFPVNEVIAVICDSVEELEKFEAENAEKTAQQKSVEVPSDVQISKSARKLIEEHDINIADLGISLGIGLYIFYSYFYSNLDDIENESA